ncbi:MAG: serine/threonine protein kinase [Phycisphaerales bacterium]|nr:serine/threonine protein kinase [Phycisphaerales bacterium]
MALDLIVTSKKLAKLLKQAAQLCEFDGDYAPAKPAFDDVISHFNHHIRELRKAHPAHFAEVEALTSLPRMGGDLLVCNRIEYVLEAITQLIQTSEKSAIGEAAKRASAVTREQIGPWTIVKQLPGGGQSTTWLVIGDESLGDERFVLKRLRGDDSKALNRFKSEIEACKSLNHPNIVKIVDYTLDGAPPYMVSEFCESGALDHYPRLNTMSELERLRLFASISEGVACAHDRKIVHRDLKPGNIFVRGDGARVVGDFGICFLQDGHLRDTSTNERVGPRYFMAPELAEGRADPIMPASDVYSLGKLLYWLMRNDGRIFDRERHRLPEWDLTKTMPSTATTLVYDLLDKCIVESPGARIPSARGVADQTHTIVQRLEAGGRPTDLGVPSRCVWCGMGEYKVHADDEYVTKQDYNSRHVEDLGLKSEGDGNSSWIILICNYCGNIQMFRPGFLHVRQNWRRP